MRKDQEGQYQGGTLEIPDGFFVCGANFDDDAPYITICPDSANPAEDRKLPVPKALAYYLSVHWCGSEAMHKLIRENERRSVQNTIKEALGL